jgi:hypothetical protein
MSWFILRGNFGMHAFNILLGLIFKELNPRRRVYVEIPKP